MNFEKIKGLIAAPYTPFSSNGHLNLSVIARYAHQLKQTKVSGVFVGGTTGEGMLLTIAERKELTEAWAPHKSENFKIIVHVGSTSYRDAITLAEHAAEQGADAIGAMGPLFLKPTCTQDLIRYCQAIALSVPHLPFYYYHIPDISGIHLSMPEFLKEAKTQIPNLTGIKFTNADLMSMFLCMRDNDGQWDILHGQDETLLAGLSLGAQGAVGSTYNYIPSVYHKLISEFGKNDLEKARYWQEQSARFIQILIRYGGGVIGGKPLMKTIGLDCGPLRAPAKNLSDKELLEYEKTLKKEGFLQYFGVPEI